MQRRIEVVVSPQGEATVQTRGYVGGDCLLASRFLEETLGVATAERKTGEFYATEPVAQHQQSE